VLRENAGGEHISKAALVQFLQHEYEVGVPAHSVPFEIYALVSMLVAGAAVC
jgi:hypothetical protein